jgi:hypothetical protein
LLFPHTLQFLFWKIQDTLLMQTTVLCSKMKSGSKIPLQE